MNVSFRYLGPLDPWTLDPWTLKPLDLGTFGPLPFSTTSSYFLFLPLTPTSSYFICTTSSYLILPHPTPSIPRFTTRLRSLVSCLVGHLLGCLVEGLWRGGVFPNVLKGIRQDKTFTKRLKSYWWWVGGGCIWIIASALWSRVFSLRLVIELNCIRQRPELKSYGWWVVGGWVHLDNSVSSLVQSL